MNAFNRLVIIVIAVLMIAVPALLLLITFGVISAGAINTYTGYQSAVQALGGLSLSGLGAAVEIIAGIVCVVVALIALALIMRELTGGKLVARNAVIEDEPGGEIRIRSSAVKALADGAAREAGALSPSSSLSTHKSRYSVACGMKAPPSENVAELADRVRENIGKVLGEQQVPTKDVEVTVRGFEKPGARNTR